MGSVHDVNSKPVAHRDETVETTATQSCNLSVSNRLVESSLLTDSMEPVLAPSLQIRTGSCNPLLSPTTLSGPHKTSQTFILHPPTPSFEVTPSKFTKTKNPFRVTQSTEDSTRSPAKARFGRPYCPINLILTLSPSLIDF